MRYMIGSLAVSMLLTSCGSGSSVTLPQEKKLKLVFSASTSAALPTAVRKITVQASIPPGVSVPVLIDGKTLDADKIISFNHITPYGSYSASKITLEIQDTSGFYSKNVGDFAGIYLNYTDSISVTQQQLMTANTPLPYFDAKGHVAGSGTDTPLTSLLKPSMKVTF